MIKMVSVVIPCYNHGIYIDECVNSVLKQTISCFEIIIVDDNSSDDTSRIVKRQESKNPKIKTFFHEKTFGVSCARNFGIRQAVGDYILTLDSDDWIHQEFLQYTMTVLDSGIADIAYTDIVLFGKKQITRKMPDYRFEDFLNQNQFCSCILFHKKHWEEVGGYNETFLDGYEDWEFGINMGNHAHFGHRISLPLFYYRQKANSRNTIARKNEWAIRSRLQSMYPNLKVS